MTTTIGALLAAVKITNADGTPTAYFVRFINQQILDRLGGLVAMSNTELADEIGDLMGEQFTPATDPLAMQTAQAVDELRSELASVRTDCDQLRQQIAERDSELLGLRVMNDLRLRVEQLEDRTP
jgi:ribosomal protein L29